MRNTARQIEIPAGLQPGQVIGHSERDRVLAASGEVMAQLKEINAANQKHINEQAAKIEAQEETLEKHDAYIVELNNKIEAAHRAPRGNGDGFMGGDGLASNKARKDLGDFARGIRAAMSSDSAPDGGFVVAPELDRTITQISSQTSAIRRVASVIEIGTSVYIRTINLQGVAAGWVAERQSRPETAGFKLGQIELPVHELYAMPAITQALLDDAYVDAGAELELQIGKKLASVEADALANGDGAGKPFGLLCANYPKVADASWAWGKLGWVKSGDATGFIAPTTSVSPADAIIDLVYALKPEYKANAVFIMNTKTASAVRKFKDADGRYLWSDSIVPGQPPTLLATPFSSTKLSLMSVPAHIRLRSAISSRATSLLTGSARGSCAITSRTSRTSSSTQPSVSAAAW